MVIPPLSLFQNNYKRAYVPVSTSLETSLFVDGEIRMTVSYILYLLLFIYLDYGMIEL